VRWRGTTLVLLALNVVLLGVVWRQHRLLAAREQSSAAAAQASSSSGPAIAGGRSPGGGENSTQAPPENLLSSAPTNRPNFDWHQVESDDYHTYIRNLRSIGCPEQTIRDIVSADVVSAFASRRQEALSNLYSDFKYWDANPSNQVNAVEIQRRRHAVDVEMNATLQDLLGQEFVPPDDSLAWKQSELGLQLAFLPPDVRTKRKSFCSNTRAPIRPRMRCPTATPAPEIPRNTSKSWPISPRNGPRSPPY